MKEANDANPLSQESKLTRVNLQLNLCPSKSTTPVLKPILFQYHKVNLQPWSILYIEGLQVIIFKKNIIIIFRSLEINFVFANSADPDEMNSSGSALFVIITGKVYTAVWVVIILSGMRSYLMNQERFTMRPLMIGTIISDLQAFSKKKLSIFQH